MRRIAQPDQTDLFATPMLPPGMQYVTEFLNRDEERALLDRLANAPFEHSRYREFTAKRRTVSYGFSYDFSHGKLEPAAAIAEFLLPLRERVAAAANVDAAQFAQSLITEYRPGSALGWHRDVPDFEFVAGVSLANPCRMRVRPYVTATQLGGHRRSAKDVITLELQPRSLYIFRGEARWGWQHSIPTTTALRYSITFRTHRACSPTQQTVG